MGRRMSVMADTSCPSTRAGRARDDGPGTPGRSSWCSAPRGERQCRSARTVRSASQDAFASSGDGRGGGTRTHNLVLPKHVRYRLRYAPTVSCSDSAHDPASGRLGLACTARSAIAGRCQTTSTEPWNGANRPTRPVDDTDADEPGELTSLPGSWKRGLPAQRTSRGKVTVPNPGWARLAGDESQPFGWTEAVVRSSSWLTTMRGPCRGTMVGAVEPTPGRSPRLPSRSRRPPVRTAGPSARSRRASARPSAGRSVSHRRAPLETLVLLVGGQLRAMDRELPLGEIAAAPRRVARSAKKSWRSPRSRSSVGAPDGRSSHAPSAADAGRRDREDASTSAARSRASR